MNAHEQMAPHVADRPIGSPIPDHERTLEPPDRTALHLERFFPRTPGAARIEGPRSPPRGLVVFVHGFASYGSPYRHVAASFAESGAEVTTFDLRGHGRSEGRRGHVRRFREYLDDLAAVITDARTGHPDLPWALVGHSMGATIVLDHLLSAAPLPTCAIAATPYLDVSMRVPWYKALIAPVADLLLPAVTMPHGIPFSGCSSDPEVVARIESDPSVVRVASARWHRECQRAQARILERAHGLRVPTLVLVAGQDRVVSSEASLRFARAAGGAVEVRSYPDLYHEVFLEPARGQVIEDAAAWLMNRWSGTPGI
jgi:alpha-beta hydrolase superfamily lysophospholipase